ncbi:MAG: tyrosine--tRNA ligase [Clostridia bacterium]|nr:tyrosine--tRNA ligase [Clostridia bacterium]MDD4799101.1 tyrosine--tRNA ligase [Clostridia bacterium]
MTNVYDILEARGYIEQSSNADEVKKQLGEGPVTFYIGFDPTADSLHVGHFIQIMVMMHMQKAGHRPIAVLGGATAMIGDPSGRTDMRKMLTLEQLQHNVDCFRQQFKRFLSFDGQNGLIMTDNKEWLLDLKYIEFIREYGRHFSVNRMLTADCYKTRLEKGLTFLEFNYMLMQSYDFLELYRRYGCLLQLGGSDQWSNILSGADLIRRVESAPANALTFRLLTTASGKKMGKTESGAVWIDPDKTSPYEFFQYWRNIDDADVKNCLKLLTFLPLEEIAELTKQGTNPNTAKEKLAYEVTSLVHGKNEADKALAAARALFAGGGENENIPSSELDAAELGEGMDILKIMSFAGIISGTSEGRRLIKEGGAYLNNERVTSHEQIITPADFNNGKILLRKGKKVYHQIVLK